MLCNFCPKSENCDTPCYTLGSYLRGEIDLETAVKAKKRQARRHYLENRIMEFLDPPKPVEEDTLLVVKAFLKGYLSLSQFRREIRFLLPLGAWQDLVRLIVRSV